MTILASIEKLIASWDQLPKTKITPVHVLHKFAGYGFVDGCSTGWVVNKDISVVLQDDDMDTTYLCIVLHNHPVATIRWRAGSRIVLDLHGDQPIDMHSDPMQWPVEVRKLLEIIHQAISAVTPPSPQPTGWQRLREYFK